LAAGACSLARSQNSFCMQGLKMTNSILLELTLTYVVNFRWLIEGDANTGCVRKVLSVWSVLNGVEQAVELSESPVGAIWSFCAFPNVCCRWYGVSSCYKPFSRSVWHCLLRLFTSTGLKIERLVFGDRSKLPTEPTHFRTLWAWLDQTPPTFRPFTERVFLLSDRSDRTARSSRTHAL
jgi:hypothetical protein